jgi:hypothetical protein
MSLQQLQTFSRFFLWVAGDAEVLAEVAGAEVVAEGGTVFMSPFGGAAVVFVMKKVLFRFFPADFLFAAFAHVPFVFVDCDSVLSDLPFFKFVEGATAFFSG